MVNAKKDFLWSTIHQGLDSVKDSLSERGFAPVAVLYARPPRWAGDDQDTVMTWPHDFPRAERIRLLKEMAESYEANTVGTQQHAFETGGRA